MSTQLQDVLIQKLNPPTRKPGLFTLCGGPLHIVFTPFAADGKPHLEYRDASRAINFSGDQIRIVDTEIGTLVTVTILMTVDAGSTSFTLFVPQVNLQSPETQIHTLGVTTHHRVSVLPTLNQGQTEIYAVRQLQGTLQAAR
ncbi:MAG TPA: hypothetical protein VNW97_23930 [Candidatus Saccharimonadales bacterium]|jgi:hypothetical protein|nr:hypothetical protein [Candidatus Saccharimonadales bacterium]